MGPEDHSEAGEVKAAVLPFIPSRLAIVDASNPANATVCDVGYQQSDRIACLTAFYLWRDKGYQKLRPRFSKLEPYLKARGYPKATFYERKDIGETVDRLAQATGHSSLRLEVPNWFAKRVRRHKLAWRSGIKPSQQDHADREAAIVRTLCSELDRGTTVDEAIINCALTYGWALGDEGEDEQVSIHNGDQPAEQEALTNRPATGPLVKAEPQAQQTALDFDDEDEYEDLEPATDEGDEEPPAVIIDVQVTEIVGIEHTDRNVATDHSACQAQIGKWKDAYESIKVRLDDGDPTGVLQADLRLKRTRIKELEAENAKLEARITKLEARDDGERVFVLPAPPTFDDEDRFR